MKTRIYNLAAAVLCLLLWMAAPVLSATTNVTLGSAVNFPSSAAGKVYLVERTLDFSVLTAVSNDVYQTLNVPSGTLVQAVGYTVDQGSTNGFCKIDVGDGSDVDGWIALGDVRTGQTAYAGSSWSFPTTAATVVTNATLSLVRDTVIQGLAGTNINPVTNVTINLTTLTAYPFTAAGTPYAAGKFYATADTIDTKLYYSVGAESGSKALKVTIRALMCPVGIGTR